MKMLLADWQIKTKVLMVHPEKSMITPFHAQQVRNSLGVKDLGRKLISYGLSSFGYDIRLSDKEFKVFRHVPGTIVDPKSFNPDNLQDAPRFEDESGTGFILPGNSYGLGVAVERLNIPRNITVLCIGKSTYCRAGVIANLSPAEAGWCLAADTDILAKTGWKPLKDVLVGEEVLTLNPVTREAEYQPIAKCFSRYWSGDLLHFSSNTVDQLVTPDHMLYVGKKVKGKLAFSRVPARNVFGHHGYQLSRQFAWRGTDMEDTISFGKYDFNTNLFLEFVGAWLGDGSAYLGTDGGYTVKLAVVSKVLKRDYFRCLLQEMGLRFSESKWGFSFFCKELCQYLMPYKGAHSKRIPPQLKQLPPYRLRHVIHGLLMSDGNMETETYSSVSKQLVDDFQEIALKAGESATIWSKQGVFNDSTFLCYKSRVAHHSNQPKIRPENHRLVPYEGMVYDITVPNHVFMSRRNGRASWTGNCGHLTIEFSNSSPADVKIYANEGVVQLLFFEGEDCEVSYSDRQGKYQGQSHQITLPKA